MKWSIEYSNDTGPNDESFFELWEVSDGVKIFKSDNVKYAQWLCNLLNALEQK